MFLLCLISFSGVVVILVLVPVLLDVVVVILVGYVVVDVGCRFCLLFVLLFGSWVVALLLL